MGKNKLINFDTHKSTPICDFEKIVYTVSLRSEKIWIYGKIGHTYEILTSIIPSNIMYADCLDIIIRKDKKSSLLNLKHKYKYMRIFCKIMIECGADIHLANDEELFEIRKAWSSGFWSGK